MNSSQVISLVRMDDLWFRNRTLNSEDDNFTGNNLDHICRNTCRNTGPSGSNSSNHLRQIVTRCYLCSVLNWWGTHLAHLSYICVYIYVYWYVCIFKIFYICMNFSQIGLPVWERLMISGQFRTSTLYKSILSPLDIINYKLTVSSNPTRLLQLACTFILCDI
jgi:hypothetical protein